MMIMVTTPVSVVTYAGEFSQAKATVSATAMTGTTMLISGAMSARGQAQWQARART